MEKMREWGFPVALIVAWMLAAAYAGSFLIEPERNQPPEPVPAEEVIVAS